MGTKGVQTLAHLIYKMEMKLNQPHKLTVAEKEEIRNTVAFLRRMKERGKCLADIICWVNQKMPEDEKIT